MIIGVDPGATVGVAFVDLDGSIVDVLSGKGLSVADVVFEIQQHGQAFAIATDRNPAPRPVRKVAAAFKCFLYEPEEHLSVAEKNELLKSIDVELRRRLNNHEKDALAAALKAFNHYSAKLRNIKKRTGKRFEEEVRKAFRLE